MRRFCSVLVCLASLTTVASLAGCGGGADAAPTSVGPNGPDGSTGATNGTGGTRGLDLTGGTAGTVDCDGGKCTLVNPPGCGDGTVQTDLNEKCDDGNTLAGDGCNGACQAEPNWTCPPAGGACTRNVICGDGVIGPGEVCDEGNAPPSGGCTSNCTVQQSGFTCVAGQACVRTNVCGNGRVEPGETCDDGDSVSGNGCSATCQVESGWTCRTPGRPCSPAPRCGDGIVQANLGEVCDQGQYQGQPGCSDDCKTMDAACTCAPGQACVCQTPVCGDGKVQVGEQCDDANSPYPGCSATCQLERGYQCPFAGAPCVPACGDGILVTPAEQCDPGMTIPNIAQACNANCTVKPGWACDNASCHQTVCGDGKVEGVEGCDPLPRNTDLGDGCTALCQAEPTCPAAGGGCTTTCGDGLVMGSERCDDGNAVNGDGCSSTCQVEPGWECSQPPLGDTMVVPMVVRDFNAGGDFEKGSSFARDHNYATQALLQNTLDARGLKPVLASTMGLYNGSSQDSGIASAASFAQWFNDTAPASGNSYRGTLAMPFTLYQNQAGTAYVNRYGNNGDGLTAAKFERLQSQTCISAAQVAKDATGAPIPCVACYYDADPTTPQCDGNGGAPQYCNINGQQPDRCALVGTNYVGTIVLGSFDGNPLFFPADAFPLPWSPSTTAQISGNYDPSWPPDPTGKNHNFSFTTEVRFWFKYDATQAYNLSFVGDDDVWVFINKHLAVDLGGIHAAVEGVLTFGSTGAPRAVVTPTNVAGATPITSNPTLGLQNGSVYEIVVFQAERQTMASSYQLSLSGFNAAHSVCKPICGGANPAISPGQECNNGNAGNCDPAGSDCYNQCTTECKLGPRCGDGVVQSGHEQCDNGKNTDGYAAAGSTACAPGCTLPPKCGDGKVQLGYGEECDDGGANCAGATPDDCYGQCTGDCKLGPYCGDGIKNGSEACDDGKNDGTYATCGTNCTPPPRCGDGEVQADWGEKCDSGAANCDPTTTTCAQEQCTTSCVYPGGCGDGIPQSGEQCDYGSASNTGDYGGCTPGCLLAPYCGDGMKNGPEQCDAGKDLNTGEYGGCTAQCRLAAHCGDGILQEQYEQCDHGPDNGTDGLCSTACKTVIYVPQ